jgi:rSAM/selenodomain-associated transferase 1
MRRESAATEECLTIGLMAKYWESGKVKTRLGAAIGMNRAARIHRVFVEYLCGALRDAGDRRWFSLSPIERRGDVLSMLKSQSRETLSSEVLSSEADWLIVDQGIGNLGDRMQRWFSSCLTAPASRAILMGTDCPTIRRELISAADQLLREHDLVIGPARDGGYYLIGLRGEWSQHESRYQSLFREIPWSTSEVLEVTRKRANSIGLAVAELELAEDVDTIVELENLLDQLGRRDAELKTAIELILADPDLADAP